MSSTPQIPACGHAAPAHGDPLCAHLQAVADTTVEYLRWYIGTGLNAELLCSACTAQRERGEPVATAHVCEACFERATVDDGAIAGVRGKAGFAVREEPWPHAITTTPLPAGFGNVVDIAPIEGDSRPLWLLLTDDRRLVRFDAASGDASLLAQCSLAAEPGDDFMRVSPRQRLHVSRGGNFAAVVNDLGRYGQVIDLHSGQVTLALDGGDYHHDTVPFSFAFVHLHGRDYAIHRTAWNRLDVSDPSNGALLSAREPTRYRDGEARPPHYLDYFHGALAVSPGHTCALSDGWVWHPVGMPFAWSVAAWIDGNAWESEDGPTRRKLCWREYYWNGGAAWIDERRVVIGGIGDDDVAMIDGARCFDVDARDSDDPRAARELLAFAGPAGEFFSDGTWLYSADGAGLSRWDVDDGARTGFIAGFTPARFHRGAREFVQVVAGALVRGKLG